MDRADHYPHLTGLLDFSRPRAFIFDLDGTLLDSAPWHAQAFRETLTEHAPDLLTRFDETMIKGRGSLDVFSNLANQDSERIAFLAADKRRRYLKFIQEKKVHPLAGAIDLLRLIRSKGRLSIVATSSSENTAKTSLEAAGLTNLFDYIITGEQAVFGKPSSDLFQRALRRAQLRPWQAVTIEDAEVGIEASRLAEVEAVLVNQMNPPYGIPTFRTLSDLYERVRSDFERAGISDTLPKQDVASISQTESLWDSRLGERPPNYDPRSDQELLQLFKIAAERGEPVRLMRIGSPLLFRKQLLGILDETGVREGAAIDVFLDSRIPSIRVLLADPDGVALLGRLDYERAGSWGIWRVRHEVLCLAKALTMLATHRRDGEVEVGFHSADLIWNIGVVGQTLVVVRAYSHGSGHDTSVESQWLRTGDPSCLAESFVNFLDAVSIEAKTKWLTPDLIETFLSSPPRWPSLYKGNAVLSSERDFDKEDFSTNVPKHVRKICRNLENHNSERKWLLTTDEQLKSLKHFRPVRLAYLGPGKVPRILARTPLVMERVQGVSLFRVVSLINEAGQIAEQREASSILLGEILFDSVEALREFRQLAESVHPAKSRQKYDYRQRLVSALTEIRGLIGPIPTDTFNQAIEDAIKLGEILEGIATAPFRDAHLKNRLWSTSEPAPDLVKRLLMIDRSSLRNEINKALRDIDFETTGYNVTEWDDVIHLLFFEYSGAGPLCEGINVIESYERWWGPVENESSLWQTVLARSTRELARRLWYARTMPNTYLQRYKLETRDYFLGLALFAIGQLKAYKHLERLLNKIKDSPEVWTRVGEGSYQPALIAHHPDDATTLTSDNNFYDVFIAHNTLDKAHALVLVKALEKAGLRPWLDVQEIAPGRWFLDAMQAAIGRTNSAAIILGTHGLGDIQELELRTFVIECAKRHVPLIPILLPGVDNIPSELLFLQQLQHVKFHKSLDEKDALDSLIWAIKGMKPQSNF